MCVFFLLFMSCGIIFGITWIFFKFGIMVGILSIFGLFILGLIVGIILDEIEQKRYKDSQCLTQSKV